MHKRPKKVARAVRKQISIPWGLLKKDTIPTSEKKKIHKQIADIFHSVQATTSVPIVNLSTTQIESEKPKQQVRPRGLTRSKSFSLGVPRSVLHRGDPKRLQLSPNQQKKRSSEEQDVPERFVSAPTTDTTAVFVSPINKKVTTVPLETPPKTTKKKSKTRTSKKKSKSRSTKSGAFLINKEGIFFDEKASNQNQSSNWNPEDLIDEEFMDETTTTWEAPKEILQELTSKDQKRLKEQIRKVNQKKASQKKVVPKQVIGELAEEELLLILHELVDENPEANTLLRDLYRRVEEIRKMHHLRQI